MPLKLIIIAALVTAVSSFYLLHHPMELERYFLCRKLGEWCFPKLDPLQRHRRITVFLGVLLAITLLAIAFVWFMRRMNTGLPR